MTFQTFEDYKEWCINVTENENLEIKTLENQTPNSIMLENIQNSDPILVLEIVLSAYDSDFILGSFHANEDNGSIIIYQD